MVGVGLALAAGVRVLFVGRVVVLVGDVVVLVVFLVASLVVLLVGVLLGAAGLGMIQLDGSLGLFRVKANPWASDTSTRAKLSALALAVV